MEEVDNFADDAMGRRLGNGAKFYGKRKSSFYGEDDEDKKKDPNAADASEDFSGPMGGSFYYLSKEKDDQGRPMGFLTRGQMREEKRREEQEGWAEARQSQQMSDAFGDALKGQEGD